MNWPQYEAVKLLQLVVTSLWCHETRPRFPIFWWWSLSYLQVSHYYCWCHMHVNDAELAHFCSYVNTGVLMACLHTSPITWSSLHERFCISCLCSLVSICSHQPLQKTHCVAWQQLSAIFRVEYFFSILLRAQVDVINQSDSLKLKVMN